MQSPSNNIAEMWGKINKVKPLQDTGAKLLLRVLLQYLHLCLPGERGLANQMYAPWTAG